LSLHIFLFLYSYSAPPVLHSFPTRRSSDLEMQVLAETGCYADMTFPTGVFHPAQISKINSLYECALPLNHRAPHRKGFNLGCGRPPRIFPLVVQGPLMVDFAPSHRSRPIGIENGSLTGRTP